MRFQCNIIDKCAGCHSTKARNIAEKKNNVLVNCRTKWKYYTVPQTCHLVLRMLQMFSIEYVTCVFFPLVVRLYSLNCYASFAYSNEINRLDLGAFKREKNKFNFTCSVRVFSAKAQISSSRRYPIVDCLRVVMTFIDQMLNDSLTIRWYCHSRRHIFCKTIQILAGKCEWERGCCLCVCVCARFGCNRQSYFVDTLPNCIFKQTK